MSDTLIGAIVGGLIAVVGGFLGAVFIRWRDDERASKRLLLERVGSIEVLLSELAENTVNLELRMQEHRWSGKFEYRDQAYSQLQSFLAQALGKESWETLFKAYSPLRSPTWLYREEPSAGAAIERWQLDKDRAEELLERLNAAGEALRKERGPITAVAPKQ